MEKGINSLISLLESSYGVCDTESCKSPLPRHLEVVALSDLKCSDKGNLSLMRSDGQTSRPSRPNVPDNLCMSKIRNHMVAHCQKTTVSRSCQCEGLNSESCSHHSGRVSPLARM